MKTLLLKRLRREAKVAVIAPDTPFREDGICWLIDWMEYEYEIRRYILRRVAELKGKRK